MTKLLAYALLAILPGGCVDEPTYEEWQLEIAPKPGADRCMLSSATLLVTQRHGEFAASSSISSQHVTIVDAAGRVFVAVDEGPSNALRTTELTLHRSEPSDLEGMRPLAILWGTAVIKGTDCGGTFDVSGEVLDATAACDPSPAWCNANWL